VGRPPSLSKERYYPDESILTEVFPPSPYPLSDHSNTLEFFISPREEKLKENLIKENKLRFRSHSSSLIPKNNQNIRLPGPSSIDLPISSEFNIKKSSTRTRKKKVNKYPTFSTNLRFICF